MAKFGKKGILGVIGGLVLIGASVVCTVLAKGKNDNNDGDETTAEYEELEATETEVEEAE